MLLRFVGVHPECNKTALGLRPMFSFAVFVVLPILPFLFVALIDALPSIWNSAFGMGFLFLFFIIPACLTKKNLLGCGLEGSCVL